MMHFFRKSRRDGPQPQVPAGERVYAVGDVHGRFDLLVELVRLIEADDAARGPAGTTVVMLGDLIDRGPQSAQVIEWLRGFRPAFARFRFVMGNHEEAMLSSLDDATGDPTSGWMMFGGDATLLSYDVPTRLLALPGPALVAALHHYVPRAHLAFLRGFEDHVTIGDYLFVHAGIRPGVPLAEQKASDLRWIRDDFLRYRRAHDHVVVHGHTISEEPEFRDNRIGIDTGAYYSGVLTALGLEGGERWTVATTAAAPAERPAAA